MTLDPLQLWNIDHWDMLDKNRTLHQREKEIEEAMCKPIVS